MEVLDDLYGRTLGEFVLREQIGEGGYGAVYRSEQPLLKRDVVVKVLHERRRHKDLAQERFLREAQLASQLRHPYAAHVYAFGAERDDGLLWIAMELVQGITLDDWLEARGSMPLGQFVPFFECVAQVVRAAHELGIVHRDLKPSNVMVIESGGSLYPKLLDFGIAKMNHEVAPPMPEAGPDGSGAEGHGSGDEPSSDGLVTARIRATPQRVQRTRTDPPATNRHQLTRQGAGIGSRAYMSPEQWSNARDVGPAADIYSLGVVAYEALTGRVPFTAETTDEYYWRHLEAEVPPLGGDFSPDLDRIVQRALAKRPDDRYGNVLMLAAALREALRAQLREQLREASQRWSDRGRSPGLLWRGKVLAELEKWTRRAGSVVLSDVEHSFIDASRRHVRRTAWIWRSLGALAAAAALAGIQYRAVMRARMAQDHAVMQTRLAEQESRAAQKLVTQAELEQGRSGLLYGEPDALLHLIEAYKRDPSPSTAFMLARALQSRLAERVRFTSSSGRMWSAAFSPDGRRIVTTDDRSAQVRDAQTGRSLFTLPHGDAVYHAVYSTDGARLVTASGDGSVRIWDMSDGSLARTLTRDGKRPRYYVVAISPDNKLVAAIDIKGAVVHVWDVGSGAPVAELRNDGSRYPGLIFSPDSRWLAMGGGNDIRVLDTSTWTLALALTGRHLRRFAFDPTRPRLVTGSSKGDVSIWSIPNGARIWHLREVGEPVNAVAYSPDGELVVAASDDGAEQVWRAETGTLQSQDNHLHGKILSVEFDRTSRLVVAASASGKVAVSDAKQGMPITVLDGPRTLRVAHFDPSSRRVVGVSSDGTARIWDATAPYRRGGSPPVADDCDLVTGLEPDQRFVAVGCRDYPTYVWDTARDQLLAELPSVSHVEGDWTSAFPAVSAEGDRAAIARGTTVEIYEVPGGRLLRKIAHGAAVNSVAFASVGHEVVSGAVDGSLLVTRDGRDPIVLPGFPGGIDAAGLLADGRVVAADARRRVRIYDPALRTVLADLEIPSRVMSLRISPDDQQLITIPSYLDRMTSPVLLDLHRYRVAAQLDGHVGRVFSVRWVAGSQILTAGNDSTTRLWDSTGRIRRTFYGGSRFIVDATLTSDGSMVVAGDADGLLRFWDASTGRPLWTMLAHRSPVVGIRVESDTIVTRGFSGDISRWVLPRPVQAIEACGEHQTCAIVPQ